MDGRRQPHNLQGLLKFALEHTRSEDAPNASHYEQLDPERREFLEQALRSMSVDVMKEFHQAIEVLENEGYSSEQQTNALNTIRDYIDDLDFANNFIKIGGSKIILEKLQSSNPVLRKGSAYIIAEMSQNNPFSQKHFIDANVLSVLVSYLSENEDVASSSMHAISALVRDFEPGCASFLEMGGLECILGCLQSEHCKVFIKACFLVNTLSSEYEIVRDQFITLGAIERLSKYVEPITGFDIKLESVLSALNVLIQTNEGKAACGRTNLSSSLQTIIDYNSEKAECEEMIEYSKNLLNCFTGSPTTCAER